MKYWLTIIISFIYFHCFSAIPNDFERFLDALSQVESGGNSRAYNKNEGAIGIYQIRKLYFIDAQSYDKSLNKYTHENCFDREVAKRVVWAYMNKYEARAVRENDWESLARLHNSGPKWRNKVNLTNKYWAKVKKYLD